MANSFAHSFPFQRRLSKIMTFCSGTHRYLAPCRLMQIGVLVVLLCLADVSTSAQVQDFQRLQSSVEELTRVFQKISSRYVDKTDPTEIATAGIDGMMSALDPYSVLLRGAESEAFDQLSSGTYIGFGYTVGQRDGKLVITDVRPGFAAANAGLRRGDRLCTVDGIRVDTLAVDSLRKYTRGTVGSRSEYAVTRNGTDTTRLILTRQLIPVQNIGTCTILADGVGYVELLRFSRNAPTELADTIMALQRQGQLRSLILDLRGNPGGLLDAAISIGNLFLPQGSLVSYTLDHDGRRTDFLATLPALFPQLPLAVLIDERSASASEVLTGALQDYDRAVVVGRQSFGKGLVQNVVPVNDSVSVKLTTARYYTPSGRCVQRRVRMDPYQTGTTHFVTRNGRPLHASNGILPDSVVTDIALPAILETLSRSGAFADFAAEFVDQHQQGKSATSRQSLTQQFATYASALPARRVSKTLEHVHQALDSARKHNEPSSTIKILEQAQKSILKDVLASISQHRAQLEPILKAEIKACKGNASEAALERLPTDNAVQVARTILSNGQYAGFLDGDSNSDQ